MKFSIVQTSDSETKVLLERQVKSLENIVKSIHQTDSDAVLIDKNDIDNYFLNIKRIYYQINFNVKSDFTENKILSKNDFIQMMDNSVKYGAKNLNICINNDFEIEISDDGIGIPKEDQRYL